MAQFNFYNKNSFNPPPRQRLLPVLERLLGVYKLWHEYLPHILKTARYTLGSKIDLLFIETLEAIIKAQYTSRERKIQWVKIATIKLDVLKFFLRILWEIKSLDTKKYIKLSEELDLIGRMLGGWIRRLQKKNSSIN